jgi:hypothetical protein
VKASALLRIIWLTGGLALLLGAVREPVLGLIPKARELPRVDGGSGLPWINDGFLPAGAHQYIAPGLLPTHIPNASSWVAGDQWRGRGETAWFRASRRLVHVGVAGYPSHGGCSISAEFRDAAGAMTRIECPLPSPGERWNVWEIRRARQRRRRADCRRR